MPMWSSPHALRTEMGTKVVAGGAAHLDSGRGDLGVLEGLLTGGGGQALRLAEPAGLRRSRPLQVPHSSLIPAAMEALLALPPLSKLERVRGSHFQVYMNPQALQPKFPHPMATEVFREDQVSQF